MTKAELLKIAKPILFNSDMVRAILEGRKTVTRRVVKLPKWIEKQDNGSYTLFAEGTCYEKQCFEEIATYLNRPCRHGDILYVRETWNHYVHNVVGGSQKGYHEEGYFYKASPEMKSSLPSFVEYHWGEKWKPSIHMPKEAARIFLKVKDVRVERLQDITIDGIRSEGLTSMAVHAGDEEIAYEEWQILWNSTIKKTDLALYGWKANPWVWVIEFERIEPRFTILHQLPTGN